MSEGWPATHRDLLDAPVAILATISDAGFPQLTPVWFLVEDEQLKLSLNTTRQKVKNLRARPQCSLLVLDPENPYRYLEVRENARFDPDDDYAFAGRVGAKYGTDLRTRDRPGEARVVVTLEPVKVHAVAIG